MVYAPLDAGEENIPHVHDASDDTIAVLEGAGSIEDLTNGTTYEFQAGEVLAGLLGDSELAHYALMALDVIPGQAVKDALIKALPGSRGRTRLEMMDTLADRRDPRSLPA